VTLASVFESSRRRNEMALIPYVTAGYPTVEASLEHVSMAAEAGADSVEVGLPFSDPVADGPTIQFAAHHALANGFRTRDFLRSLAARPRRCPLILMTYLNPLLALGDSAFATLAQAGVSALVVPDLPESEAGSLSDAAARFDIDLVLLAAPTSTDGSLRRIGTSSRGFVYVVGVVGTTGARAQSNPELPRILGRVRAATTLPLVAGFGLSRPEHLEAIAPHADGAIVGSRLVEAIRDGEDLGVLVRSFKQATRRH
jgi:tryptophan synthase alpha chain